MNQTPDLFLVAKTFAKHNVRWVLIGGMAMVVHGATAVTGDTDVLFAYDVPNEENLVSALAELNASQLRGGAHIDRALLSQRFLHLNSDGGPIDLIRNPEGLDSFEGLYSRSVALNINGIEIRVASLNDLVTMKETSGRAKDKIHLAELMSILEQHSKPQE